MHEPPSPLEVPTARWTQAQAWERQVWRDEWTRGKRAALRRAVAVTGAGRLFPFLPRILGAGDDWNEWWLEKFEGYQVLPRRFHSALEIGCGPFTNIRLIKEGRQIDRIVCSDPLVNDYVAMRGSWLAEAYRRRHVEIDPNPAENLPFESESFDVVVMINVLDHVRDMAACVASAMRLTGRHGFLVLGQDLTSNDDAQRMPEDVGHPIRMDHHVLDRLLAEDFEPRIHKILARQEGRNPDAHYGTYIWIGEKVDKKGEAPSG